MEWESTWRTGRAIAGAGLAIFLLAFVVESALVAFTGVLLIGGACIAAVVRPYLR